MPELPEVQTTINGISPYICSYEIKNISIFQYQLRYIIDHTIKSLIGQRCLNVIRRAKYIIAMFTDVVLVIHLGMSGSLRVSQSVDNLKKHDHVVFEMGPKSYLIYHDPRRFGFIKIYSTLDKVPYFKTLGVEPLSDFFNDSFLYTAFQKTDRSVKVVLMDQKVVVGVGNIYATEVLFQCGIDPRLSAKKVPLFQVSALVLAIKNMLKRAIKQGGTTLRDFVSGDSQPGYFKQSLKVYGRSGEECFDCKETIRSIKQAQRTTAFCPQCQSCNL